MSKLIAALFPMGQRKLLVSLIALVVGVVVDRFGGGLNDNLTTSLIAIVAIFAGGNVMEHIADALKFLKGTKVGQFVEDVLPGDQGLGTPPKPMSTEEKASAAMSGVDEAHGRVDTVEERMAELEKKLAVQAQNTSQIVQILNAMRGANVQAPRQPQGPA